MLRDKGEDSRRKRIQQSRKHEIRVVLEPEEISARSDRVSKMELQRHRQSHWFQCCKECSRWHLWYRSYASLYD